MSNKSVGVMSKSKVMNDPGVIQGVNGLRGIAISMVIGYHLFPDVLPGGFLGVNLFLVLSGFLTVISSCRRLKGNRFNVIDYYLTRLMRIFPALILSVAITIVLCRFFAPDALRGIGIEVVSIFAGFNNWWQIAESSSYFTDVASSSPFVHLWYLAIEMQFYLVWPLLFYFVNVLRRKGFRGELVFLVLSIVSVILSVRMYSPQMDPSRVYYGTDTRIYALCIGAFLGYDYVYRRDPILDDPILVMVVFIGLMVLTIFGAMFVSPISDITYYLVLPLSALVFAMLIFIAANKRYVFGLWLDNPILNWLNTNSYILYLIHYPIIYLMTQIFGTMDFVVVLISIMLMVALTIWINMFDDMVKTLIKRRMGS